MILHAGDIVTPRILDWLEGIAPVVAALGNDDFEMDDPRVRPIQLLDLEGWWVGLVHDTTLGIRFERAVDVVVGGHTHYERLAIEGGVVHVNPGSATLPHHRSLRLGTVGIMDVDRERLSATILRLGDGPLAGGSLLPNPGRALRLEVSHEGL